MVMKIIFVEQSHGKSIIGEHKSWSILCTLMPNISEDLRLSQEILWVVHTHSDKQPIAQRVQKSIKRFREKPKNVFVEWTFELSNII